MWFVALPLNVRPPKTFFPGHVPDTQDLIMDLLLKYQGFIHGFTILIPKIYSWIFF